MVPGRRALLRAATGSGSRQGQPVSRRGMADNPLYRRGQGLPRVGEGNAWRLVENDEVDWRTRERASCSMGALTTAMAPTNLLAGNPEAIKHAITTGGRSLL